MGVFELDASPVSQGTVSDVSNRSVCPLQLSSIPLSTTPSAPRVPFAGSAPQRPGLAQQSPLAPSQPSPSQSVTALSQGTHTDPMHLSTPGHAVRQSPQCAGSFVRSTHLLPHFARPPPQIPAHWP